MVLISLYRLKIVQVKHQHENISFSILSLLSPPPRLVLSPSICLPMSHFCIYLRTCDTRAIVFTIFFLSSADESYSSRLHSKWKIGSRCCSCDASPDYETRPRTLTVREAFIEKSQELPYFSPFWPHLTSKCAFEKFPTSFLEGACVTLSSTNK